VKLGLRGRMLAASGLLAAVVAGAFTLVVLEVRDQHAAARSAQRAAEVTAVANELERLAIDLQSGMRGFVITGNEAFLAPWEGARARIPAQIEELERLILDDAQRERAAEIGRLVRDFDFEFAAPVVALARSNRDRAVERVAAGEGKQRMDEIRSAFDRFAEVERRIAAERQARAEREFETTFAAGLGGLAGSVLLVLLVAGYLSRSIVTPVGRVAGAAGRLARGDLSARVPPGGVAEIGQLGNTFNEMAVSLEESRDELETQQAELEAQQAELEEALTHLGEEKERVAAFYEFGGLVAAETELVPLARAVLDELSEFAGAEIGTLYARETEENGGFFLLASRGLDANRLPARLLPGEGLAGRAAEEARTVVASYDATGLRLPVFGDEVAVRHEAHVPLVHADRMLGVLTLARVGDRPFTTADEAALEHLAGQAAVAVASALALQTARRNASINESVLNATVEGISLVDAEGKTVFRNAAMERIASELGANGGPLADLLSGDSTDLEQETLEEIEAGERSFKVYAGGVRGPDRELIGRILTVRDVSSEREAERLKSDLVATVSHELRTPLASILGFTELLVARDLDEETRDRYLNTIYGESKRLTTLINDFLDLQRVEEGGLTLALATLDVGEVVRQQAELFEGQSKAHSIAVDVPDEPLLVLGELPRIEQVLANLLSNAIKYSPEGGTIEVAAKMSAAMVRISVSDRGLGVPADQQAQLFTKFFRVETPERRAIGGTGLGLALSREIVEAHGGRIGFQSIEGKGSTFWFELPVGARPNGRPGAHVLVIEDDPEAALLLREHLEAEGYDVEVAATGEEGLARAIERPPAAVCLDIILPGQVDGWQVLASLKARPATADVPVIVCTGKNGRDRASALGAADFVTKPFSGERIKQAVAGLLPQKRGSVLVVDDEENVRRLVVETLSGDGVEVREAADGLEALAKIESDRPDAIVLDLVMPRLDGFSVLERLQQDEETRSIPVIVLTAMRLSPEERNVLHKRAVSLLEKSAYSPAELRRLIAQAIGAHVTR